MHHLSPLRRAAGFSLIELMIGLVIGMLAIVVMMQVFSTSESYKRTTTGGDDAQSNGAIAMYSVQRDLQQSGFGITALQVVGCNLLLRTGVTLNAMAPATINHAGIPSTARDNNTDTLVLFYGNGNGAAEGERVEAQPATNTYTVAAAAVSAAASAAFSAGDFVIAEPSPRPSTCNLSLGTVASIAGANVTVSGAGMAGVSGGTVYNLGPRRPKALVYAVYQGNLTVCDYGVDDCGLSSNVGNPAVWVPIVSNVVSLRAEYGRNTLSLVTGPVDTWDQATPTTPCQWARTSAVRFVLVARSATYDKNDQRLATISAPAWASTAAPITLSGDADWQHYRYKTFQTVVPLRNTAWQTQQARSPGGC